MDELPTRANLKPERTRVEEWRRDQLEKAGYPGDYAVGLAANPNVDLHVAVELLKHGCPVETAQQILS